MAATGAEHCHRGHGFQTISASGKTRSSARQIIHLLCGPPLRALHGVHRHRLHSGKMHNQPASRRNSDAAEIHPQAPTATPPVPPMTIRKFWNIRDPPISMNSRRTMALQMNKSGRGRTTIPARVHDSNSVSAAWQPRVVGTTKRKYCLGRAAAMPFYQLDQTADGVIAQPPAALRPVTGKNRTCGYW